MADDADDAAVSELEDGIGPHLSETEGSYARTIRRSLDLIAESRHLLIQSRNKVPLKD